MDLFFINKISNRKKEENKVWKTIKNSVRNYQKFIIENLE
jgi:hypothetical protein